MKKVVAIALLSFVAYAIYRAFSAQSKGVSDLGKAVKTSIERIGGVLRIGQPAPNAISDPNKFDEALWNLWCKIYWQGNPIINPTQSATSADPFAKDFSAREYDRLTVAAALYSPEETTCAGVRRRLIERGFKFE